jgi:putative pyruvate formate lyase activating enzyme
VIVNRVNTFQPAYYRLEKEGLFAERLEQASQILKSCQLCPCCCKVNRCEGEKGFCQAPARAVVNSYQPHFGEEGPLVGRGGSGTIFFSYCSLRCVFCQNWTIAHQGQGREVDAEEMAAMMLILQDMGCHNINLVTPTHFMPSILQAIHLAMQKGLKLPICYNTSGYERPEMIKLLDGIVDIYLADFKFMSGNQAAHYTLAEASDYPMVAKAALKEMHRQVGNLICDENNIAMSGLMIRHLVMPDHAAGTREFVSWAAAELSPQTYVNIMPQYRPSHMAKRYQKISRAITPHEYNEALTWAREAGLTNLDEQAPA